MAIAALVPRKSLASLGKGNQTRTLARLAAWNKRQLQFIERKAKGAAHS